MRPIATALLAAFVLPLTANAQRPAHTAARADWRRGGVCYEIFVRSFFDSNGDGVGDLNGVAAKLDYVKGLGVRCIWLMPVAESPSYHGYDVSNYYKVQPAYGTNADFKRLVGAAHRRGIAILVDMVLNHASSEHPYFLSALRDTASMYRSWFRFSKTHPNQPGPWGQDAWHKSPVRDEYYYGVFTAEMPDLNYETPAVRDEAKKIAAFWTDSMGVDGFRLDAVPYLVEEANGQLMNGPGTHEVLREYGAYLRRTHPGAFTVGEVWGPVDSLLPYYPDQLDDYFAFEAADAMINAENSGSSTGLFAPFLRLQAAEPADRWSPFLSNHDQTRTLTKLGGDLAKARQAATLLLTLPGLPFVYYGEEIGMTGDKPDPRLRTPMQWTGGRAAGFTRGTPWEALQPDSGTANVQAQTNDAGSLLSLYRNLIRLRASNSAVADGVLVPLTADNDAVAAYLRRDDQREVLVVANLGRTPLANVKLTSAIDALWPGTYRATALLGSAAASALSVGRDGRVSDYVPLPTLGPRATYVFELRLAR